MGVRVLNFLGLDFSDPSTKEFVVIFLIVVGVMFCFSNKSEVFVCKNKYSFCTLDSVNRLNISKSTPIFMAQDTKFYEIEKYVLAKRRRSYSSRASRTRYNLKLSNSAGSSKVIFRDYRNQQNAETVGKNIIDCINKEQYPCKFTRYDF